MKDSPTIILNNRQLSFYTVLYYGSVWRPILRFPWRHNNQIGPQTLISTFRVTEAIGYIYF